MLINLKNLYRPPSVATKAARELQEAEIDLLGAHAQLEAWTSAVDIYTSRVKRLRELLAQQGEAK